MAKVPSWLSGLVSLARRVIKHRMGQWSWASALLAVPLLWFFPSQAGVYAQKILFVTVAAVLGYWIDRVAFYYARPADSDGKVIVDHESMNAAMLRRAIIMAACMLAVAIGV